MRLRFFSMLILALLLGSCSGYYKLLKSDDAIAKYEAAMEFYANKKYEKAITMFDSAMPTLVNTTREDTMLYTLGKAYYESGDFNSAGEVMNEYRKRFPRSTNTHEAEYIYAMSFYFLSPDVEKDQSATRRAISAFGEYLNRYPQSKYTPEIQRLNEELNDKLYYKRFLNASLYYKLGHYRSAVTSLRAVLKENPETPYQEEILYLITKSWYDYARNSITSRQLDRYLNTIDAYYNFRSAFATSELYDKELERMKAMAQDFVDSNGVTAQAIETSATKVADAQKAIEEAKDELFEARTLAGRAEARKKIKAQREIVSVESKKAREEEKILRQSEKKKAKELKEKEKAAKEAAKQEASDLEGQVEELREEVK